MSEQEHKNQEAEEESGTKGEGNKPTHQWGNVFKDTWHDFHSGGWLQNAIIGLVFALIAPAIGVLMNSPRVIIIGAASGLTLFIWIVAILMIRQVPLVSKVETSIPTPSPTSTPSSQLDQPTFTENVDECTIFFGGNTFSWPISDLKARPRSALDANGVKPIAYIEDNKFYVDVIVTSDNPILPVEIKRNNIIAKPPNWDTNSSSTAFEVVDDHQLVVFQIIYRKPSKIVLNGIFPTPQRRDVLLYVNETTSFLGKERPKGFTIKRIFKYPAWKYPSQYE